MSAIKALTPVFVMSFPDKLEAGKLYVSMEFASVAHLCACGCGAEVVTPLSPTDWMLSFDGVSVTVPWPTLLVAMVKLPAFCPSSGTMGAAVLKK